ncbi:MAG: DUF6114 domain-containing protein, partial [Stackebrandtia sp.]
MSATDGRSLARRRRDFAAWRRARPFWGGVVAIAGALELLALSMSPVQVMMIRGLAGIGTVVIAAIVVAMVVIGWVQPQLRTITGIIVVIVGLASFAVSNLGGFIVGMLLSIVGGSLIVAWAPGGTTNGSGTTPPDAEPTNIARPSATETDGTATDPEASIADHTDPASGP